MRKPIIAGNWKMHKTLSEAKAFVAEIKERNPVNDEVEMIVCPPALFLESLVREATDTSLKVGAQNVHFEENGAFTGEISPYALRDLNVDVVIIGHSERRQLFGETDEAVSKKVHAAFKHNLIPIICCGETNQQRIAGKTNEVVKVQIEAGLTGLTEDQVKNSVLAYEPIWAIGTGKSASAADANEVCKYLRQIVANMFSTEAAETVRILYGGSVNSSNIKELMAERNIDGALVGGASLEATSFLSLVEGCK